VRFYLAKMWHIAFNKYWLFTVITFIIVIIIVLLINGISESTLGIKRVFYFKNFGQLHFSLLNYFKIIIKWRICNLLFIGSICLLLSVFILTKISKFTVFETLSLTCIVSLNFKFLCGISSWSVGQFLRDTIRISLFYNLSLIIPSQEIPLIWYDFWLKSYVQMNNFVIGKITSKHFNINSFIHC
jgi:hypothetical protein